MFRVDRFPGWEVLKCFTSRVAEQCRFCRQDGEAQVQRTEHHQPVGSQHQPGYGGSGGTRPRGPGGGRPGLCGEPGVWAPTLKSRDEARSPVSPAASRAKWTRIVESWHTPVIPALGKPISRPPGLQGTDSENTKCSKLTQGPVTLDLDVSATLALTM